MKRIYLIIIHVLIGISVAAREPIIHDTIQHITIPVEHVGMATGMVTDVEVLPFKKVQLEMSMQYEYTNGGHGIYLPITTVRIGVSHFAEMSIEYAGVLQSGPKQWEYTVQPLVLCTKMRLYEGKKWIPKMTAMASLAIPSTTLLARTTHVAPSVALLFQNDISEKWHISYVAGLEWNGESPAPITMVALSVGYNFIEEFSIFAENFIYFGPIVMGEKLKTNVNVDIGFNYLIHPRVDIGAYVAINCQNPKEFTSMMMGVAWLIN